MSLFRTNDISPPTTGAASSSYDINNHICPVCRQQRPQKSTATHDASTAIPTPRLKASMPAPSRALPGPPRNRSLPRSTTRSLLSPASVGRYNVNVTASTGTATRAHHTAAQQQQQARALTATRPAGKENLELASSTALETEEVAEEKSVNKKPETRAKKPRARRASEEDEEEEEEEPDEKSGGGDPGDAINSKNADKDIRNEKTNALNTTIVNNNNNNPQPGQHQPGCWECELTRRHIFELWSAAGHGSVLEREQEKLNHARRRV